VNLYSFVGMVEGQTLDLLLAEDASSGRCRLTRASEEAAFQQQQIDIMSHDGLVVLVRGVRHNDWISSAVIVERASQLLSVIAQAAFGRPPRFPGG
jgi:hypothetical protein